MIPASVLSNPFQMITTRVRCGCGGLVIDGYADGEIVNATLVRGGQPIQSLKRAEFRALRMMLERLGAVVTYADFGAPQDSVRRDLRNLRSSLETLDLDLDAIPGVGYRLRVTNSEVRTTQIGDVRVDNDGRVLHCGNHKESIGSNVLGVFIALAERPQDCASLYRSVWGGKVPYEVNDLVQARVGDVRDVLRRIGSNCRVNTSTLHDTLTGRRTPCYVLRLPESERRKVVWPQRSFEQLPSLPAEQIGLFDISSMPTTVKSRRVSWSAIRRVPQNASDYIMVIA